VEHHCPLTDLPLGYVIGDHVADLVGILLQGQNQVSVLEDRLHAGT
jgi:hypothetical protein